MMQCCNPGPPSALASLTWHNRLRTTNTSQPFNDKIYVSEASYPRYSEAEHPAFEWASRGPPPLQLHMELRRLRLDMIKLQPNCESSLGPSNLSACWEIRRPTPLMAQYPVCPDAAGCWCVRCFPHHSFPYD